MTYEILKNKNCLITGATGGIGKKLSFILTTNNCNLFLTSTNSKKLLSLKQKLENLKCDTKISVFSGDLTKDSDLKKIVSNARRFGKFDILINCAGIFPQTLLNKSSLSEFDRCLGVNMRAPFFLCKEFSKDMIKKKWGRIVNIGSSSSYAGFPKNSVYCSSKHAILGFSRSLHEELKQYNVRTFCVSPSSVKTNMGKKLKNQDYCSFMEPRDVADFIIKIISYDDNMVLNEIQLKRMVYR